MNKTSVYLSKSLQQQLENIGAGPGATRSRSGAINAIADRYREICRQSRPALSVGEWCVLFDALSGAWMQENPDLVRLAVWSPAARLADALLDDPIDAKWGVDGNALVQRLLSIPFATGVAIVDAAERFWARDDWPADRDEMVRAVVGAGAISD